VKFRFVAAEKEDDVLTKEVQAVHESSRRTYGSPRVHARLKQQGRKVGRKRIARVMREQGLVGRRKRRSRRTTDSNHPFPIADNVLARAFTAERPNEVWVR
jgi:putative transposase